jgi:subtilisin family serine protease
MATASAPQRRTSSRDWAYEVVCLRDRDAAAMPRATRSTRAASPRSPTSDLDELIISGRAERVFDGAERGAMASANRALDLPEFVAVGAQDEREARDLLQRLQADQPAATVYVAPPRHVLARASGARAAAAAATPTHWGMTALGLANPSIDASGITIAVVDTGVDLEHPDLKDAVDDYVNYTRDPDRDQDGHGTHVCGIVAATGSLPAGMRGVSNARLLVFKGLGKRYSARNYYRALRAACTRARIVNLSLGGAYHDPGEQVIIDQALRRGTLVIAAMGNEFDVGNATNYPAALAGVLAVGAVDSKFAHASFSNTGTHIALVAPGVDIWSTAPTHRSGTFGAKTAYAPCDGTSMAAPFVTGVVALLAASATDAWDAQAIRDKIPLKRCPGQSRKTDKLGAGLLHWPGPLELRTA